MRSIGRTWLAAAIAALVVAGSVGAQTVDVEKRLEGFDAYMEKVVRDWNAPGVGVGIVVGDRLVFAKGYGHRDVEHKLPFTRTTLCPIASNSKLFTAVAAGLLVEEGKLDWDTPIKRSVPSITFYNNELDTTVTLRDMLGHRTGITRHDLIWYRSDFTRKQLYERLQYMEPKEPLRTLFLYNNMMYAATGHVIELQSGRTWEEFVRERIFAPLGMGSTVYSIADMVKAPDFGVGFTEKRDSTEIYKIPYYEDTVAMAPAGAIISNIEDMSHWLSALMNDGAWGGKQVIPPAVLEATLQPGMAQPNTLGETRGWWEMLNPTYGMGRQTASYRGHLLTYHGGDIDGFHSQVSYLPQEKIGVVVFVIGDHCGRLYNIVSWNVYERLLGLDQTPWSERFNEIRLKGKKESTEARTKAGAERVTGTTPSHPIAAYAGSYEHPAYGTLKVSSKDGALTFDFRKIVLPLSHFHYDRFDTPDDEQFGKWSVNFLTNPQGDIERAVMSLDEAEVAFVRAAETLDPTLLGQLPGTYATGSGFSFQVAQRDDGTLAVVMPGRPEVRLVPYKGLVFKVKEFSDLLFEFVVEDGKPKALKQRDPSGEFVFTRK